MSKPKEILWKRLLKNKMLKESEPQFYCPSGKIVLPPLLDRSTKAQEQDYGTTKNVHQTRSPEKNRAQKHDRDIVTKVPPSKYHIPNKNRMFTGPKRKPRKDLPTPFIMEEPNTICDVDETYFSVISGRPVRSKLDINEYRNYLRNCVLWKADAGYLKEEMLKIEKTHYFEDNRHNMIESMLKEIRSSFIEFTKNSYADAKVEEKKAAEIAQLMFKKKYELDGYGLTYVRLRNEVSNIFASFQILSTYRNFLQKLVPSWWLKEHEDLKFKIPSTLEIFSRECLETFRKYAGIPKQINPIEYLKTPEKVIEAFGDIERQCLNYMSIRIEHSSNILKYVLKSRDMIKIELSKTSNEMNEGLDISRAKVEWMEQKEIELENEFFRLLLKNFQKLFGSYQVAKIFRCLQYTHSHLFSGYDDPRDSIRSMALDLEVMFYDLTLKLDGLDQAIVKKVTNEIFKHDLKTMRKANEAQRLLKEWAIMEKALFNSVTPPYQRSRKQK